MLTRQKGSVGKYKVDYKLEHFYRNYKRTSSNQVTRQQYTAFIKDMTDEFMRSMIESSNDVKIPGIGYFSILSHKPKVIKDGKLNKKALRPDWKKTWEYWYKIYEGKTQKEIIDINDKKVIYHENKHSQGLSFVFKWNKFTSNIKGKKGYKFIPTSTNKKKLNNYIKENPNHCYYGL